MKTFLLCLAIALQMSAYDFSNNNDKSYNQQMQELNNRNRMQQMEQQTQQNNYKLQQIEQQINLDRMNDSLRKSRNQMNEYTNKIKKDRGY